MVDSWLTGLLDDASARIEPAKITENGLLGSVVVPDDRLAAVDRGLDGPDPVPCRVINTGGAGGLLALSRRRFERLRVTGVRTGLRDLDDLAGAAARVAVAARELDPDLLVMIEIPDAPGWQRAVETAELEGLSAAVRDDGDPAPRLEALIEADVPFVITGPVGTADRVVELIMIIAGIVDGTVPADGPPDPDQGRRIRRRLLGIEVESPAAVAQQLADRGWPLDH
ncbi:hypothetical protein [Microlunatus sp. GCM10028923]|uniref:hypothetical protein n=1 Tax=Microlunatus sp. GCM10028923 TaxID=3273400 RepID=UPI00361F4D05